MLLSIDVGIKNLAFCLFETPEKILDWNVINLCEKQQEPHNQHQLCTQPKCKFKAKFTSPKSHKSPNSCKLTDDSLDEFYCTRHAKKSKLIIPSRSTSKTTINAMRVAELRDFASRHITSTACLDSPEHRLTMSKPALAELINLFILNNSLIVFDQFKHSERCESSKKISLIDIGISMKGHFDIFFSKHIQHISTIIIENQISPIAGRLKTLQGMIAQYFIMHGKTDIQFVSSSNKLKGHDNTIDTQNNNPKDDYKIRKMASIRITDEMIACKFPEWVTVFKTHKKRDDLADAFLQGVWFNRKYIK